MSTTTDLTHVVQSLYAAFGRGDISALLAGVSDDVDWHINVDPAAPGFANVPTLQRYVGRKGVGDFFASLATSYEFHVFQPLAFFQNANAVAAQVRMEMTVRRTQRRFRCISMHMFTFDEGGRVSAFEEFTDTLGLAAAWGVVKAS